MQDITSSFSFAGLTPMLPELFLAAAGMVLLVAGVLRGNTATAFINKAVMISFLITILLLLGLNWDEVHILNNMFVMDQFAGFMKLLVLCGLIASVGLSTQYIYQDGIIRFEYAIIVLFSGLGMLLMLSASNLLSLYVALELQSLSLYVLAAIRRDHPKSAESGMKYFVLGAISSGMLLFGSSLIYGYTGSLDFATIASVTAASPSMGAVIGMVFILSALAFKISAVPFHMWTPDVYEGAPTSVTALFAMVPKLAAMGLIARLVVQAFPAIQEDWVQILWFLSAASMAVGAFAGIAQRNIKRLLAYSSIGNMGYALIGLVTASSTGVGGMIIYMAIYMMMTAGTFGIVMNMRRDGKAVKKIGDLAGLSRNSPFMAYALALLMFSMSGIPPLAGFFGKLLVFKAAVASGLYVLAVFGVLTSVVAAFYYLRIIKVMFFDEPADKFDDNIGFARRTVIFISVFFIVAFIVSPSALIEISMRAAASLFPG
jgi:NADH-quinone oxidoreductase subunit N